MRLLTSLKRLEAGAAVSRETAPAAVGLIWSRHETTVDPDSLERYEYIAVDVRVMGAAPCDGRPAMAGQAPTVWEMLERVTQDPQDLGVVRDAEGARVGRVTAIEGSMLTIQWDEVLQLKPAPYDELSPAT